MQLTDPLTFVRDFCAKPEGNILSNFFKRKKSPEIEETVSKIKGWLADKPILDKWRIVRCFETEFMKGELDPDKVKLLETALSEEINSLGWRDLLVGSNQNKRVDKYAVELKYSNSMDIPIQVDSRLHLFPGDEVLCAFGSTFTTNKVNRVSIEGDCILDAVFGSLCLSEHNQFNGYALAIADGAGGHFGDPKQDESIGYTAHTAVECAVRLMSAYQEPESLSKDMKSIIKLLQDAIRFKGKGESTTLACCRVFPYQDGFRIIGMMIGDNMVVAWDPRQKKVYHLFPSHCSDAGTALLPDSFKEFEVRFLDTLVPDDCLLYMMTDGIHDSLPFTEVIKEYSNGLTYKERTLDKMEMIFQDIPENADEKVFLKTLISKAFESIENERRNQTEQNINIGDDFSVIQCKLTKRKGNNE